MQVSHITSRLLGYFIYTACIASMHLVADVMKTKSEPDEEVEHVTARDALYKGANKWGIDGKCCATKMNPSCDIH